MPSTIALRRRIRSVKSTRQITKAMELVAASKMRRAQEATLRSRDYRQVAREILLRLRELTDVEKHPLFVTRTIKTKLYVIVTSDRGLAGAYDSNVNRTLLRHIRDDEAENIHVKLIVLGKKGANFAARLENVDIMAVFDEFAENPAPHDIQPLLNLVVEAYEDKSVDAVDIIYTDYKSSIVQEVRTQRLLPAAYKNGVKKDVDAEVDEVFFEPSPTQVLESVGKRLVEVQLWQDLLESQASEQAARMMAMKTASDNAEELIDDLTLEMNTARQAAITQELAEIVGGAEAML